MCEGRDVRINGTFIDLGSETLNDESWVWLIPATHGSGGGRESYVSEMVRRRKMRLGDPFADQGLIKKQLRPKYWERIWDESGGRPGCHQQ